MKVWTLEAFECLSNRCSRWLKRQDIGKSRERDLFNVTASGRRATEASDLHVHLQGFDVRLEFKWRTQLGIAKPSCLVKVQSSPPLIHLCLCSCLSCGVVGSCLSCVKSLPGKQVLVLLVTGFSLFLLPACDFLVSSSYLGTIMSVVLTANLRKDGYKCVSLEYLLSC